MNILNRWLSSIDQLNCNTYLPDFIYLFCDDNNSLHTKLVSKYMESLTPYMIQKDSFYHSGLHIHEKSHKLYYRYDGNPYSEHTPYQTSIKFLYDATKNAELYYTAWLYLLLRTLNSNHPYIPDQIKSVTRLFDDDFYQLCDTMKEKLYIPYYSPRSQYIPLISWTSLIDRDDIQKSYIDYLHAVMNTIRANYYFILIDEYDFEEELRQVQN